MLDQVYGAIADPTRRAILGILAEGEANVGSLAERFPISLNGVSKHVKVLERAGLVERTVQGREHRLRLNAEPLREACDVAGALPHVLGYPAGGVGGVPPEATRTGSEHPREDGR